MRLLLSIMACLLIVGVVATARTVEYRTQTGSCDGKDAGWWSVTTIVDGIATHITGITCDGKLYDKDIERLRFVSSDPTTGLAPTFAGACTTAGWKVVIQHDADQYPHWMAGQGCDGRYWVLDNFTEPAPGDDLE